MSSAKGVYQGRVGIVSTPDEKLAIELLRRQAYERAAEFSILKSSAYSWDEDDNLGYVLGVWDKDRNALATMRGIVAAGRTEAEDHFECSVPLEGSYFPSLLLGRGATLVNRSSVGLNSLLRYHFFEAAIQMDLHSVLGAVFDGAPRIRLLKSLGYEFRKPDRVWDENLKIRSPILIASLRQDDFCRARTLLIETVERLFHEFPWEGATISRS
jgi:hypothetical protein